MWPKSCRLTYTHDTPPPNIPRPNRKPRQAARVGVTSSHNRKSSAGNRNASGKKSNGANAIGRAAPAPSAVISATRGRGCAKLFFSRPICGRNGRDFQQVDAAAVGAQYFEAQAFELDAFAAPRHMAEGRHHQPADGVDLAACQPGVKPG